MLLFIIIVVIDYNRYVLDFDSHDEQLSILRARSLVFLVWMVRKASNGLDGPFLQSIAFRVFDVDSGGKTEIYEIVWVYIYIEYSHWIYIIGVYIYIYIWDEI